MAAALSGPGPNSHDSTATLSTIVPRHRRLRDEFYKRLLAAPAGPHGRAVAARGGIEAEAAVRRDPAAPEPDCSRQSGTAASRNITWPYCSRRWATRRRVAGGRIRIATAVGAELRRVRARPTSAAIEAQRGGSTPRPASGRGRGLLSRGIDCGALADPWNMLGFQGLFPLFAGREDSVHDSRIDELLELVGGLFAAYAGRPGRGGGRGDGRTPGRADRELQRLAAWWDQFAGYEVADLQRVHGGDAAARAEHVATALALWRAGGPAASVAAGAGVLAGAPGRVPDAAAFARVVAALFDRGRSARRSPC